MNSPVNLLVDYKDTSGKYYHQVFKAYHATNEKTAAACIMEQLRRDGFIPCAIAMIYGRHTMEGLGRIQNSPPVPNTGRLLYIDMAEY